MGKRPTDHLEPAAKKRGADRQITKDDGEKAEEHSEQEEHVEAGSFQRANEDVLKQRKIVRARRAAGATGSSDNVNPFAGVALQAPAAVNPFAAVALVQPAAAAAEGAAVQAEAPKQVAATTEQPEAGGEAAAEPAKAAAPAAAGGGGFGGLGAAGGSLFGAAAPASGFTGASGGGFGSLASGTALTGFSFGGASVAGTTGIFSFGAAPAPASGAAAVPSLAGGGLFGTAPPPAGTSVFGSSPSVKVELPAEQPVTTGEEGEKTVFAGEAALFEYDANRQWKERGRGELRVNVAPSGQGRLVMRQKGNLRLLMNANLWAEMQVTKMEGGKGATFVCVNAAAAGEETTPGKKDAAKEAPIEPKEVPAATTQLSTFAARFKTADDVEGFAAAVDGAKAAPAKEAAA